MEILAMILLALLALPQSNCSFLNARHLTYKDARQAVIEAEDRLTTGGRIQLSSKEAQVDYLFRQHKTEELARGFRDPDTNAAGMHFFKAKSLIEHSKVFRLLRRMPKGGILHIHNSASVSSEWIVRNISYMPELLRCTMKDNVSLLSFRRAPKLHGCQTNYVRVSDERRRSVSAQAYDLNFAKLINLYTPEPELIYSSIERVWTKFENIFRTLGDALHYLPAYRAFHWQMLEEMYTDNVMYAEVRMNFWQLYDISGRTFPLEHSIKELLDVIADFRHQHPNFLGIKVIYSVSRNVDQGTVHDKMEFFKTIHAAHPNFIVGFDLVGQEDKGKPLHTFVEALSDLPKTAQYFFHAGETNWYGASTDINLLDAILLNTTRIGHGYALMKHPVLWNAVKTRDIAIEVSPISNQVLHLVADMRNHPGGFFISQDIPMVICNDDPGFWNVRGLSYDFYYAIMSMAPSNAGLKTLKSLAWSSIRYSALKSHERALAFASLQRDWERFIDDVLLGRPSDLTDLRN